MAITKVTSGLISADASSIDLNIDAGTLYLDVSENKVGIGTSSPSAKLHITGDTGIRVNNSANTQQFDLKAQGSNLGIENFFGSGSTITLGTNANGGGVTERMRIDSSGNVGIGQSSLGHKLTVNASAFDGVQFQSGGSDCGYLGVNTNTVYVGAGSNLIFHTGNAGLTNGSERMRIDSSGLVGIGRTPSSSTGSMLQVEGNDGIAMRRPSQTNNFTLRPNASTDGMRFTQEGAGDRMIIDSSGNVGIGVSSPQAKLQLLDTDAVYLQWTDSGNIAGRIGVNGSYMHFGLDGANGETERMRIDASGNLLVGTTSVAPATQDGFVLYPQGTLHVTRADDYVLYLNRRGSDGVLARMVNDGVVVGGINVSGSSTSYNTSSDYRLKENVNYDFTALDRVSQLKPARFNFIADETNTLVDGFLAHEVQDIVPEAITGEKDAVDSEGNPEYQGIDQSKLVPLLTKAIQELSDKVDNQQTIINDLKTRIETLENA